MRFITVVCVKCQNLNNNLLLCQVKFSRYNGEIKRLNFFLDLSLLTLYIRIQLHRTKSNPKHQKVTKRFAIDIISAKRRVKDVFPFFNGFESISIRT